VLIFLILFFSAVISFYIFYGRLIAGKWITADAVDYELHETKEKLVIFFLPSNELSDWIIDFLAWPSDPAVFRGEKYKVPKGFMTAFWLWKEKNVFPGSELYSQIEAAMTDGKEIELLGYSFGAPIALYFFLFLTDEFPGIGAKMYGYGSPRWGNKKFTKKVESLGKSTFYKYGSDIVTMLAPWFHQYSYIPMGKKKFFPSFRDHGEYNIWGTR
jgi:hypothetical protein